MKRTVICFVVALLIDVTSASRFNLNIGSQCETPKRTKGTCVSLRDCPDLYSSVLNFRQLTYADRTFLRLFQCGQWRHTPLVCCEIVVTSVPQARALPSPGRCGNANSKTTSHPWMALVKYFKPGETPTYRCGGSLINQKYVLTAAHCTIGKGLRGWNPEVVRLGETSSNFDCEHAECKVVDVPIAEIIPHHKYGPYSRAQNNDIALIRLNHSVTFTDIVKPVCLPFASHMMNKTFDNVPLIVVGFGQFENGNDTSAVKINGFNWIQCDKIYTKLSGIPLDATQLCAGDYAGRDSCSRVSGGPLLAMDDPFTRMPYTYLVGVLSRGPRMCGTQTNPAIYTRVDQYLTWISYNVKL